MGILDNWGLGGSSGSTTPTTQSSTQGSIPAELQGYAQSALDKLQTLANQPMQVYGGQQVADLNPLQTTSMQNAGALTRSPYTDQAAAMAGAAGTNQFTGANVNQYMSPYIQNVIQNQEQGAIRDYARQLPQMAGLAAQTGGLGGTRQALVQGEAQRNLQNQLGNIQATGLQNAFQNAQGQFNTANQNTLAAAGVLGQAGNQAFNQDVGAINAQMGAGNVGYNQNQNTLNAQYQQWANQQNYPWMQGNQLISAVRGVPVSNSNVYNSASSPNLVSQISGLLQNATSTTGGKAGGEIKPKQHGLGSLIGRAATRN